MIPNSESSTGVLFVAIMWQSKFMRYSLNLRRRPPAAANGEQSARLPSATARLPAFHRPLAYFLHQCGFDLRPISSPQIAGFRQDDEREDRPNTRPRTKPLIVRMVTESLIHPLFDRCPNGAEMLVLCQDHAENLNRLGLFRQSAAPRAHDSPVCGCAGARMLNPSSRWIRCTRFRFTTQPSAFSEVKIGESGRNRDPSQHKTSRVGILPFLPMHTSIC
jgi:hypothetical protein